MRCDQCRHWRMDEDDWQAGEVGFRRCFAIVEQWYITERATKDEVYPFRPEGEPIGGPIPPDRQAALDRYSKLQADAIISERAYVIDGSQYRAELWTGADFFCAKFDAQEVEQIAENANCSDG